jgi:hypothetical protein
MFHGVKMNESVAEKRKKEEELKEERQIPDHPT